MENLDEQIQASGIYPLIDLHLPVLDGLGIEKRNESWGIQRAKKFYQGLDLDTRISLENMHDPYRNGNNGFWMMGNKPEHFTEIIGDRDYSITIDIGHLRLSEAGLEDFLELPYDVGCVHYHGNDGNSDSHQIPNENNVDDFEDVKELIGSVGGPVVLEVRCNKYPREEVRSVIDRIRTFGW